MRFEAEHWRMLVRPLVAERLVIVTHGAARGLTGVARMMLREGAKRVMVLGIGEGTGERPGPGEAAVVVVPAFDAPTLFDLLHGQDGALRALPSEVRAAIDSFDPGGDAIVFAGSWTQMRTVADRRVLGPRPAAWAALEDKTVVDRLYSGASAPRGVVVDATVEALVEAAADGDEGAGTVWSGDARDGVNGGGDLVRLVRGAPSDDTLALFTGRCGRVRVAPFLVGLPCSVHGVVTPSGVAVFRPVEVLSLLQESTGRFFNMGTATYWSPAESVSAEIRVVSRHVGEVLAADYGYRGGFGVDGVLAASGFVMTEVNTRLSAGFATLNASIPELPFPLVDAALREGVGGEWRPNALEEFVVRCVDADRRGRLYSAWAGGNIRGQREVPILFRAGTWRAAADGERPDGRAIVGPSPGGGFFALNPAAGFEPSTPLAPAAAAGARFADDELGTAIGDLVPLHTS